MTDDKKKLGIDPPTIVEGEILLCDAGEILDLLRHLGINIDGESYVESITMNEHAAWVVKVRTM